MELLTSLGVPKEFESQLLQEGRVLAGESAALIVMDPTLK